jgi:flagellar basal body-associated protein FliL
MKKLLPIIVGVGVLLGGGYFAYKTFLAGDQKPKLSAAAVLRKAERGRKAAMRLRMKQRAPGQTISLGDDFVVNLSDPGLAHYAKFQVSLKVDAKTPVAAAAEGSTELGLEDDAQIRDIVIDQAGRFTAEQLTSNEGREKLKHRIESELSHHTETLALDVYFTSFAVQ